MSRFPRLRRRRDHWADAHARARTAARRAPRWPARRSTEATWLDEHLAGCPSCAAIAAALRGRSSRAAGAPRPDRRSRRATCGRGPRRRSRRSPARARPRRGSAPSGARAAGRRPVRARGRRPRRRRQPADLGRLSFYVGPNGGVAGEGPASSGHRVQRRRRTDGGRSHAVRGRGRARSSGSTRGRTAIPRSHGRRRTGLSGQGSAAARTCRPGTSSDLGCRTAPRDDDRGSPTRRQAVAIAKTRRCERPVVIVALPEPGRDAGAEHRRRRARRHRPPTASPQRRRVRRSAAERAGRAVDRADRSDDPAERDRRSGPRARADGRHRSGDRQRDRGRRRVGRVLARRRVVRLHRPGRPTARAAPTCIVWRVGDEQRATADRRRRASYFASWSGNELIASRPGDADTRRTGPTSACGSTRPPVTRPVPATSGGRPSIRPGGSRSPGTARLERADGDRAWSPADGSPRAPTMVGRREHREAPRPGACAHRRGGGTSDFDVRWDETGEWVAVWVADERDRSDRAPDAVPASTASDGRLEVVGTPPEDVAALPGFSIAEGRLAWATPRGHERRGQPHPDRGMVRWTASASSRAARARASSSSASSVRHANVAWHGTVRRRIVPALSCDQDGWS